MFNFFFKSSNFYVINWWNVEQIIGPTWKPHQNPGTKTEINVRIPVYNVLGILFEMASQRYPKY